VPFFRRRIPPSFHKITIHEILTPDLLAMHSQPSGALFVSQVDEKGRWNISTKNYAKIS
jgi:hypothetical protein